MAATRDTTTSWDTAAGDAPLRTWITAVNTVLSTIGLVQTSDTGQVNLATVTMPGAEGIAGYEIWRFNDAQQATNPIFIRVEYHRGDAIGTPRIQYQVGKGSNGSGTLTSAGTLSSSTTLDGADAAGRLIHGSLAEGCLLLYATPDQTNTAASMALYVERERIAGTYTGRVSVISTVSGMAEVWDSSWASGTSSGFVQVIQSGTATQLDSGATPVGRFLVPRGRALRGLCWGTTGFFTTDDTGTVEVESGESLDFRVGPSLAIFHNSGGQTTLSSYPVGTSLSASSTGRILLLNE